MDEGDAGLEISGFGALRSNGIICSEPPSMADSGSVLGGSFFFKMISLYPCRTDKKWLLKLFSTDAAGGVIMIQIGPFDVVRAATIAN